MRIDQVLLISLIFPTLYSETTCAYIDHKSRKREPDRPFIRFPKSRVKKTKSDPGLTYNLPESRAGFAASK